MIFWRSKGFTWGREAHVDRANAVLSLFFSRQGTKIASIILIPIGKPCGQPWPVSTYREEIKKIN